MSLESKYDVIRRSIESEKIKWTSKKVFGYSAAVG